MWTFGCAGWRISAGICADVFISRAQYPIRFSLPRADLERPPIEVSLWS